jgi:hypothetical protein
MFFRTMKLIRLGQQVRVGELMMYTFWSLQFDFWHLHVQNIEPLLAKRVILTTKVVYAYDVKISKDFFAKFSILGTKI